jgi:hypothetical protein
MNNDNDFQPKAASMRLDDERVRFSSSLELMDSPKV